MSTSRVAPQRTPSSDVGTSLLRAADDVLRRDGLAGVTVRAVAAEAGVAPMGVYSRFGSKDGLVDALLIRAIEDFQAAVGRNSEPDPRERLMAGGRRFREWALANRQHYEAIFLARIGLGSDEVAEASMRAFGELLARVEYAMDGGVLARADITEVAQQIWDAVHGAVALELNSLVLTADPGATYERLLDTIVRGLAP
ncbi:TetR/AcrR family transcriptional regulator [Sporichthya polymorpha]|uniref:TetR/AcrR family transcriptional regulator n=1 Tax=Sporichthya polymorpha TaxID=35751 RepID=UPI0003687960|nr:TetR/AcrR family transcriptional regulator [Sporichthya polymorpha]